MASYLEQIDAQLAALHMEMERLQIAREVIAKLEGRSKPQVLTLKANPAPSQKSGPITIRKITDGSEKPKRQRPPMDRERAPKARAKIMEMLKTEGPMTTATINAKLGHSSKREYQLIWNIMSDWKGEGVVVKDEKGRFFLPETADDQPQ